jgi:protein-disulfide isomerase
MKRYRQKDVLFISASLVLCLLSIWYACSGQTKPRVISARELSRYLDTSELTPTEAKRLEVVVNREVSPCGDDVTLAEALFNSKHCPLAPMAGRFIVDQVKEDYNEDEISKAYLARYADLKGVELPVDGSPRTGPANASITFVVFTDFRCPFCKRAAKKLDEILRAYPDEVAIVFKNLPLTSLHPQAELAARAALAAGRQDKFWEMHDTLFSANGAELPRELIDTMAEGIGLDMDQFEEDINSAAVTAALESDKKLADKLGIKSTPTVYLNGRFVGSGIHDIEERFKEELLKASLKAGR